MDGAKENSPMASVDNSRPFSDKKCPVQYDGGPEGSGSTWSNEDTHWNLPRFHSLIPTTPDPCSAEALPSCWTALETMDWYQSPLISTHLWWCKIAETCCKKCSSRSLDQDCPQNCQVSSYFLTLSLCYFVWGSPAADVKACPYSIWWPWLLPEN